MDSRITGSTEPTHPRLRGECRSDSLHGSASVPSSSSARLFLQGCLTVSGREATDRCKPRLMASRDCNLLRVWFRSLRPAECRAVRCRYVVDDDNDDSPSGQLGRNGACDRTAKRSPLSPRRWSVASDDDADYGRITRPSSRTTTAHATQSRGITALRTVRTKEPTASSAINPMAVDSGAILFQRTCRAHFRPAAVHVIRENNDAIII